MDAECAGKKKRDTQVTVTAYVRGNMEHVLLHATHSSCLLVLLLRIRTLAVVGGGAAAAVCQQGL